MSFSRPDLLWLLALAPLAALIAALVWRRRLQAAAAWASRGLWDRLLPGYRPLRLGLQVTLLGLAVGGVALGLARPRWGVSQQEVERRGVDLVFVLDTSLSMAARDLAPSRLAVAKTLIRRLTDELPGNRVGLVQAEGVGEVLSPLTLDTRALDLLLSAAEPGSLGHPGTELGPALETALDLFIQGETLHRVLVVLSDGEDHGGDLGPRLERLAEAGAVVHALGTATPEGAPVPAPGGGVKKDRSGRTVISRLGSDTLQRLALSTGGLYLPVGGSAQDLAPLVRRIGEMETAALGRDTLEVREERFQWPLATATAALLGLLGSGPFRPRRREASP
jgi:Ca-activated chloride channel family protein